MELKRLTLTHVRAFDQVEFEFHPGINLLVGINGAGKSTVLDVLRIMLSQTLPKFTASRSRALEFNKIRDITVGQRALTAELTFTAAGTLFEHFVHIPRADYMIDPGKEGQVRDQTYDLIERNDLKPDGNSLPNYLKENDKQPLVLYFSTRRSLPSMASPSRVSRGGGQAAAFAEALGHRELHIREFADWWLVQDTLAQELDQQPRLISLFSDIDFNEYRYRLNVMDIALSRFLDNCTNLRAISEPETTLLIDKDTKTLDVRMLSDGERSMIALVLDLARRLAIANPQLENPLTEGKAVVLIDELDLHLHPRWQRTITSRLTETFPNCQFIATTHSPQIVGEVSPDKIILIEDGKVMRPDQSLGMDTNWILRHLMGVDERDTETKQKLQQIEALIEAEKYDEATARIDALRHTIGEFPDLVALQTRIDMIMFLSGDEEHNEDNA